MSVFGRKSRITNIAYQSRVAFRYPREIGYASMSETTVLSVAATAVYSTLFRMYAPKLPFCQATAKLPKSKDFVKPTGSEKKFVLLLSAVLTRNSSGKR